MSPAEDLRRMSDRRRWWQILLVVAAVFSLTVSLSTRTFRLNVDHISTAQSGSATAIRQHMDRDALRWTPAIPLITALQAPTFYPQVAPAGPPLPGLVFDESLYNRPPPAC